MHVKNSHTEQIYLKRKQDKTQPQLLGHYKFISWDFLFLASSDG